MKYFVWWMSTLTLVTPLPPPPPFFMCAGFVANLATFQKKNSVPVFMILDRFYIFTSSAPCLVMHLHNFLMTK